MYTHPTVQERIDALLEEAAAAARALGVEVRHLRSRQRAFWQQALLDAPLPPALAARVADLGEARGAVLIVGEPARLRALAAAALHYAAGEADGPFVASGAADLDGGRLADFATAAGGGTLFVDDLPAAGVGIRDLLAALCAGRGAARLVAGAAAADAVEDPTGIWRRASRLDLPAGWVAASTDLKARVDEYERRLLREALRESDGNKTRAAEALGITREGLHKMLARHRI